MLSRIAKPTPWSVPSSNTIAMLLTVLLALVSPGGIAGNAWFRSDGVNFFLVQPGSIAGSPSPASTVVAAWQPRKWSTPSMVTTLKRGAPAPQWLPSRISNPKTLSVLFRTIPTAPVITTPDEAFAAVSVLFESSTAKLFGPDASVSPRPFTHAAATWFVFVGSNSNNAEPNVAANA